MSVGVHAQLARLIRDGQDPHAATETVMADLPRRWKDFARPFVLRTARGLEGEHVNSVMRAALGAGGRHRAEAEARLRGVVYRLPDGTRMLWDDMDITMLDLKIAQLRKQVGALVDHLRILETARKLCADHGVERLGDIDGWPELVHTQVAASTPAATPPGVTAREPTTSDDSRPRPGEPTKPASDDTT